MSDHQKAIAVLQSAQKSVADILKSHDDQHHALRVHHSLQREIDYLNLITGAGVKTQEVTKKLSPATSIAGETIERKEPVKPADVQPSNDKVNELKNKVEEAFTSIQSMDSKEALKSIDHLVIRGVAKKAGLKVTNKEPAKITIEFIDEIKAAIKKNAEDLEAKIVDAQEKFSVAKEEKEITEQIYNDAVKEKKEPAEIEQAQTDFAKATQDMMDAAEVLDALQKSRL